MVHGNPNAAIACTCRSLRASLDWYLAEIYLNSPLFDLDLCRELVCLSFAHGGVITATAVDPYRFSRSLDVALRPYYAEGFSKPLVRPALVSGGTAHMPVLLLPTLCHFDHMWTQE